MNVIFRTRRLLLATVLPLLVGTGYSAESGELLALRTQVQQLEQQLKVLSRKLELQDEAANAAAASAAKVAVTDKGVTLSSVDAANVIKLRGLVQLDSRLFFGDGGVTNNAFVLRRARLITEGQFARNYGYQLVTEFGGSSVSILDANFTVAVTPALQFKFGKFKVPIGLELLQSDSWTFFNERSIVTNLVPNRDLGIQVSGDLFDSRVSYQLGVFGGVGDGGSSNNNDVDNEKDLVGRITAAPFRNEPGSLQGLTLGLAASSGREKTTSGRTSGYRTDGQQTFFSYASSTVADGRIWRVAPQLDYRSGSFGAIAEYVLSTSNVRPSATGTKTELRNRGWQVSAGYVLTGEDSSYNGVVPRSNFNLAGGTWGAFEVVGRYSQLNVDDKAFPTFASVATNADSAKAIGAGLNWYLAKAVAFKIDYYQTRFGFAPNAPAVSSTPILRHNERAFITRFQLAF
jgi:phosphate-selective porin OprO/OprP